MRVVDAIMRILSRSLALERASNRAAIDTINDSLGKRGYDALVPSRKTGGLLGWLKGASSAEREVSRAERGLANIGQDLTRNNPLANRVKRVWANNAVGIGIKADVVGKNSSSVDFINKAFDEWAGSPTCDYDGTLTLYGMQWLWVSSVVESGGILIRKHVDPSTPSLLRLQVFEQSSLDKYKRGDLILDGIEKNQDGGIKGYWLLSGDGKRSSFHPADSIIHIFRKDRPGQHLGVSWFAQTAISFKDLETLTDAIVMQQQISACFAVVFEEGQGAIGINRGEGTNDVPDEITPGMVYRAKAGEKPHTITPPKADNSSKLLTGLKQDIASGSGITYEQLTGDYSMVTFASGRMGRSEHNSELDYVQNLMLKPALDQIFKWFVELQSLKTGRIFNVSPTWTFPPRASLNPQEDFSVLMDRVRSGMMSPQSAAKSLGENFAEVIDKWKEAKVIMGDMPFDIDPSLFASTGNQVIDKVSEKEGGDAN